MVDPILIEQVVLNLLKNAAEAIDNAEPAAVAAPHRAARGAAPHARRRRRDRVQRHRPGPGLKDEVIARLYEAFFSTKAEGLGIGLSLCRSIIESHRGRIRAQNLYNGTAVVGCRFTFTLPVRTPPRSIRGLRLRPQPPSLHELDSEERHRLRRRRRRGGARFAAMAARRQGLPRQVLRLVRVVPVALRSARGRLPDRRHPHGRHERARAAGPPDASARARCRSSSSPATATCRWR